MKCLYAIFIIIILHSSCAQDSEWSNSRFYPQFPLEKPWLPAKRAVKYDISFSYSDGETGPESWPMMFKECGGKKQSPININLADTQNLTVQKSLQWSSTYFIVPQSMTLMDNGHTLELQASYAQGRPTICNGPLLESYIFKNLHFHWGTNGKKGSEHTINNIHQPMEMHVVHENERAFRGVGSKYVVVAFFFQVGDVESPSLNYIIQVMGIALRNPHKKIQMSCFSLIELLSPFSFQYITYDGSLTTPPCSETVTWIINPTPLPISRRQIEAFRDARNIDPNLKNNFRPVQALNNRIVSIVQEIPFA